MGGERIFGFAVQTRYNGGFVRVLPKPTGGCQLVPGTWVTLGQMGNTLLQSDACRSQLPRFLLLNLGLPGAQLQAKARRRNSKKSGTYVENVD